MNNYIISLVFSLLFSSSIIAGNIDLKLDISIAKTTNLAFGNTVPFSLKVTNLGPEAVAAIGINESPVFIYTNAFKITELRHLELDFELDNSFDQLCRISSVTSDPIPGNPRLTIFSYILPAIPANSSITCYGLVQVFFEGQAKLLTFNVQTINSDIDIDLSNNRQEIIFSYAPRIIPTLSISTIMLLFFMVLCVGLISIKFNFSRRSYD